MYVCMHSCALQYMYVCILLATDLEGKDIKAKDISHIATKMGCPE